MPVRFGDAKVLDGDGNWAQIRPDTIVENFEVGDLKNFTSADGFSVQTATTLEGDYSLKAEYDVQNDVRWIVDNDANVTSGNKYSWMVQADTANTSASVVLGTQNESSIDGYGLDIQWFEDRVKPFKVVDGNYSEFDAKPRGLQTERPYTVVFDWRAGTLQADLINPRDKVEIAFAWEDAEFDSGGVGVRVFNSDGNTSTVYFDDIKEVTEPKTFQYQSTVSDVGAHQGIASDGTYLYTTSSRDGEKELHKYQKDGTLVDSVAEPEANGTAMAQCNGIYYYPTDGNLYIGSNNEDTANPKGYIKVFDTELNYIEEHQVRDALSEGATRYDGSWWAFYGDERVISQYDDSWTLQDTYQLAYAVDKYTLLYQGAWFEGGYLYLNIHSGNSQNYCDVYKWNGSGFDAYSRLFRPHHEATQGIAKEPNEDTMWFAVRKSQAEGDDVIKTAWHHNNGKPLGK